jgi:imidazolonepropionase-like amidohydrolase
MDPSRHSRRLQLLGRHLSCGRRAAPAHTASSSAAPKEHVLVVRGGRIVDGSGGPGFTGDVAVGADGRIAAIGQGLGAGEREIDAAGKLVTP